MSQENITLNLKASIDTSVVERDLQKWDAQEKILKNTGIERDGGITNLYAEVESNSQYVETYYAKNGRKVSLQYDAVNANYGVISGGVKIGTVPLWAVGSRSVLSVDANDVMVTLSGTFLVLRLGNSIATIQEIDTDGATIIRQRSFGIAANISDGMFVRNVAPTYANVTSIVGIFASGTRLNHCIITDASIVYTATGQLGFQNSSQVFAYYKDGWIVSANDETDTRTFCFNSAGTQQGTYTEATYLTANYNQGTGAVIFSGWRDVVALGAPVTTYGYTFTPPAAPLAAWTITAITNGSISSPAVVQFTMGGYGLIYGASKSLFYSDVAAQNTWVVGHSKLPEIYGYLDTGADIAFKAHTIAGEAGYMSASFARDGIGVPITEVGEMNAYYYPQILKCTSGDYCVVYRRGNGTFAVVRMTKTPTEPRMQEIAPGVIKINTISALCVADANDNDLQFGGNAYNGFIVVGFSGGSSTAKAYVARYRGDWGGSVDTGYKDVGSVPDVSLIAIPEGRSYSPNNETIDVYIGAPPSSLAYYRSIRDGLAQSINGKLQGTIYVDDLIIPPPAGVVYNEQTINLIGTTAVRELNYDGYQLGNEAKGQFQSFRLYGQLYLFDGIWIYAVTLNVNTIASVSRVASATGLQFLAESPQAIYFLSDFDNSIFIFDGGQSVTKMDRFSRVEPILDATYSVKENTLALFTKDTVMFVRDGGLIGQLTLPFVAPFTVFSTTQGLWISKGSYSIRYLYNAVQLGAAPITVTIDGGIWGTAYADTLDGGVWGTAYPDTIDGGIWGDGSEIVPLTWQSKFNGYSERNTQLADRLLFRFYKEDLAPVDILIEYLYFDEAGQHIETRTVSLGDTSHPYDALGYAFLEYIPERKQSIAFSIRLTCPTKIVYLDIIATVGLHAQSTINSR